MPTRMAHCFSCGGPIADGANLCSYCGGSVSLAMRGSGNTCPECYVRLARDASFCGGCGVQINVTSVVKALTSTRCPRCKGELALCEGEGARLTECLACGGLWLDEAFFETLVKQRRAQGTAVGSGALFARPGVARSAPEIEIKYVPCPNCSELMQRRMFGQGSGVVLDWCRGHGVWFDALELEEALRWCAEQPDRANWRPEPEMTADAKKANLRSFQVEKTETTSGSALIDVALQILGSWF